MLMLSWLGWAQQRPRDAGGARRCWSARGLGFFDDSVDEASDRALNRRRRRRDRESLLKLCISRASFRRPGHDWGDRVICTCSSSCVVTVAALALWVEFLHEGSARGGMKPDRRRGAVSSTERDTIGILFRSSGKAFHKGDHLLADLQHGAPTPSMWRPPNTLNSIRPRRLWLPSAVDVVEQLAPMAEKLAVADRFVAALGEIVRIAERAAGSWSSSSTSVTVSRAQAAMQERSRVTDHLVGGRLGDVVVAGGDRDAASSSTLRTARSGDLW